MRESMTKTTKWRLQSGPHQACWIRRRHIYSFNVRAVLPWLHFYTQTCITDRELYTLPPYLWIQCVYFQGYSTDAALPMRLCIAFLRLKVSLSRLFASQVRILRNFSENSGATPTIAGVVPTERFIDGMRTAWPCSNYEITNMFHARGHENVTKRGQRR